MMLRGLLLLSLCLLGVTSLTTTTENVELTIVSDGDYLKGSKLSLKCESPFNGMMDVLKVTRIVNDPAHDNKKRSFDVVTNSYLEDAFSGTGRYSISFNVLSVEKRMVLELTITNLMGADEGEIACEYVTNTGGDQKFEAVEAVIVKVPVSTVSLSSIVAGSVAELDSGVTVNFQDKQEAGFICKVAVVDGDVAPVVKVTVGDKDITEQFEKTEEAIKKVLSNGLWERSYSAEYQWKVDTPDKSHNGDTLKCEASVPGVPKNLSKSVEAKIEVVYAPVLDCRDTFYQKLAEKSASMVCRATMYPAPTGSHWEFVKGEGDQAATARIADGNTSEDMVITASFKPVDGEKDTYEFALTFTELGKTNFNDYTLSVSNTAGTAESKIKLEEEEEIETPAPVAEKSEKPESGQPTESTPVEEAIVDEIVDAESGGEPAWNAGAASVVSSFLLLATTLLLAL